MRHHGFGLAMASAALILAGCSNDSERIEELEDKIEQLESQRAAEAGGPSATPTPSPSSSAATLVAPAATPTAAQSPASDASDVDGNVCNDGQDRRLTLVNQGEQTIMYFYASPPSAGDWEEDVLGDDVVSQGDRFRINFNTDRRCTCTYDTRAVMADDSEVIRKVNVCTDHTQTYP